MTQQWTVPIFFFEIMRLNLGPKTGYPERDFSWCTVKICRKVAAMCLEIGHNLVNDALFKRTSRSSTLHYNQNESVMQVLYWGSCLFSLSWMCIFVFPCTPTPQLLCAQVVTSLVRHTQLPLKVNMPIAKHNS